MPRVLFVSKPIAPPFHDGTKCLVRDIARELRAVDPVVMTTEQGLALLPPGVEGRVVYAGSGGFSPPLIENARAALSLVRGPSDDLWHFVFAPNPRTCSVARALRRLRKIPIVQTVASPPRAFTGVGRLMFGAHVVVQSRATRESLEAAARAEGFRLPELSVVPPPVSLLPRPTSDAVARARAELRLEPHQTLVIYPGDLEVSSGAEVTARLVGPLCERHPNIVVAFAYRNKTPLAAVKARELSARLAGKSVRITDRVSDMQALLCAASIVIFPVDDLWGKVDQPIVLLEALALGTPCVVLGHGSLKDVQGACAVTTTDTKAWLDEIVPLIENSVARSRAVAAGLEAAERVYASGVVARAYEAIYLRVLQGERARRASISS